MRFGNNYRNDLIAIIIDQVEKLSISDKKIIHQLLTNELKTIKNRTLLDSDEKEMLQEIFSKC